MSDLMKILIRGLYKSGKSYRDIEKIVDFSMSSIGMICKDIVRDRSSAAKLKAPRLSTHWRSARVNARKTMQEHIGRKLNSNEHVHHKDGNYTNNDISNLEIIDPITHAKLHHPKNPTPRHLRPERKKYMRKYHRIYRKEH